MPKREWKGTLEDYFGVGWWCLKYSVPEWQRQDFYIQGLLPDLKQALWESALISLKLQESSRDSASRAQCHIHRFLVENGIHRERLSKGYSAREMSTEDLSSRYEYILERKKDLIGVRQLIAEKVDPKSWDTVWSWANSKQRHLSQEVCAILERILI